MERKKALVTGGTSGIGLSIVRELAKSDYNVCFIGTNQKRGKEVESELKSVNSNSEVNFINLDLSKLKDVQQFTENFKKQHTCLDLLANIAGVLLPKRQETVNKIEKTFAINYLAHFYLTNELIPLLEKGNDARVVNVAGKPSIIMKPKINFNDLNLTTNYKGIQASTLAIQAKTAFTQSLSERVSKKNIAVNSFDPGYVKSELFRSMPVFMRFIMKNPFFANKSNTGIYVCLSNEIKGVSGKLFVGKKAMDIDFDKDYQDRLWEKSEAMIKEIL